MSNATLSNVPAPINEIELMRALEDVVKVAAAYSFPPDTCSPEEIARAVTWLHSKYGSPPCPSP